MNKRQIKKQAKLFLDGKKNFPTYEDTVILSSDGDYVIKVLYKLPQKIHHDIRIEAYRRGWDGCHWNAPDLVGHYEQTGEYIPNPAWS